MSQARALEAHREVEAAISRVLDAEQAARASVAQAQADAAALTEDARAAVRALDARMERRLAKVRAAFAARTDAAVAALDAQSLAPESIVPLTADDLAALRRALATVAADLTSPAS